MGLVVPCGSQGGDAFDCVVCVVRMVELVDMCCCCDCYVYGGIYGGLEEEVPRAWCCAESKML